MNEPTPAYEFDSNQNALIADLAKKMRLVGIVMMVFGVVALIGGIAHFVGMSNWKEAPLGATTSIGLAQVLYALIYLCLGVWTKNAGDSFRRITATQGSDVNYLMEALGNLRKIYTFFYVLIIIGVIMWLVFMVIFLVTAFMSK